MILRCLPLLCLVSQAWACVGPAPYRHAHSHSGLQADCPKPPKPDMPTSDEPRPTGANGYSTCVFDVPRWGPGRHGGSINKDAPITLADADQCADRCFDTPGCIGVNFYGERRYCYLKREIRGQALGETGWDTCTMVHLTDNGELVKKPYQMPSNDVAFESELRAVQDRARADAKLRWDQTPWDPPCQGAGPGHSHADPANTFDFNQPANTPNHGHSHTGWN